MSQREPTVGPAGSADGNLTTTIGNPTARQSAAREPGSNASPVRSMTGYAHIEVRLRDGMFVLELRSVNSRFTDVNIRLPDEWRAIEPALRERIAAYVRRGKLECRVQWFPTQQAPAALELDEDRVASLAALAQHLRQAVPDLRGWSVAELLAFDGVLVTQRAGSSNVGVVPAADTESDSDALCAALAASSRDARSAWAAVREPIEAAFVHFVRMREREGLRLRETIEHHLAGIETEVGRIRPQVPLLLENARERLTARLREALPSDAVIPAEESFARIRQEVALLGLRADIAEELDRMSSHVTEARRALLHGGAVGKRLEFLAQEMNREANTVGSKAVGLAISETSLALKLLVEQIREQVQNLE